MENWQKENIATMAITAALVIGLYAAGAGGHSFWGLIMLVSLNYIKREQQWKK